VGPPVDPSQHELPANRSLIRNKAQTPCVQSCEEFTANPEIVKK